MSKLLYLARIQVSSELTYVRSFLISKIFLVFVLIVMFNLFKVLYAGRPIFAGFTIAHILFYLTITETIEMSKYPIHRKISEEIKDGSCAYALLRPMSYLSFHYASSVGTILVQAAITLSIGLVVSSVISYWPSGMCGNLLLAFPAILLAIHLNFMVMLIIGLAAFYIEETEPVYWIYQKAVFIIGGMLIPHDFFPQWLQAIVRWLPLTYISYFPAKMAVHFSWPAFGRGIAMQVLYLAVFWLLAWALYRRGIKRLEIMGG